MSQEPDKNNDTPQTDKSITQNETDQSITQNETPAAQNTESTTEVITESNQPEQQQNQDDFHSTSTKPTTKEYPGGERFDPSSLPQSDDAAEIRKQVEFYFSDSNLSQDKYLYTMTSENSGWADLRSVANFKRMRRFQPYTAVVEALRSSTFLDVDEQGEKIKRKSELKPFSAANMPVARSIYVKGFPAETKTLQIELEKFFEKFGDVKVVRMRRTEDGKFKGSVFVEYATLDEQKGVLELFASTGQEHPRFEGQAEGVELEVKSKRAYLDQKEREYGGKFPQNNSTKKPFNAFAKRREDERNSARGGNGSRGGRGGGRGDSRGRGGRGGGRGRGGGGAGGDRGDRGDRGRDRPRRNDRNQERQAQAQEEKQENGSAGTGGVAGGGDAGHTESSATKEPETGDKRAATDDAHDTSTAQTDSKKAKTEE